MLLGILSFVIALGILGVSFKYKNTGIPRLCIIFCFAIALIMCFVPNYTLQVGNEYYGLNILKFIGGTHITTSVGYEWSIASNRLYSVLIVLPIMGIIIDVLWRDRFAVLSTAIFAFICLVFDVVLLFKQEQINDVINFGISIGLVVMFIAYGVILAISIMRIYELLNYRRN